MLYSIARVPKLETVAFAAQRGCPDSRLARASGLGTGPLTHNRSCRITRAEYFSCVLFRVCVGPELFSTCGIIYLEIPYSYLMRSLL